MTIWSRMLSLYFQKAADMKPKVIRQVLMTIIRFVTGTSCPHKEANIVVNDVIESATLTSLALIYSKDQRSDTRAAMKLCEIFLAKHLVSVTSFCQTISKAKNVAEADEDYDVGKLLEGRISSGLTLPGNLIEGFVATLVGWVQYADTAPSSGRLLKRLFIYLQSYAGRDLLPSEQPEEQLPLWVYPLKETILLHPHLLEAIGNHVLPELLQIDYAESFKFLKSLPLSKLQGSDVADVSDEDIQFCLCIITILRKKGLDQLIADLGLHSPDEFTLVTPETTEEADAHTLSRSIDIEKLALRFLSHKNSSISITALSILTVSSSHTKPFLPERLASLKQNIPFFHAESDSKFRGEYISVMKRALRRFDSILTRLSHTPWESRHSNHSIPDSSWDRLINENNRVRSEALHRSFLNWYIGYIAQELQPTASYQRHITSLRILQIMQTGMLLDTLQVRLLSLSVRR